MTTYTITEAQRQQLLDLAMPVVSTPNRIALKLLLNLTPNSGERSPITELQEWWDSGNEQYHELEAIFIKYVKPAQPLTDADILGLFEELPLYDVDMIYFARAIEASHGIKGQA